MDEDTEDPFNLDGELFNLIAFRLQASGEAFAAYRMGGQPMVLRSLVDGLPICALHLLVVDGNSHALIARGNLDSFLGVVSKDDTQIALVMTNLTNDVLMLDIGGTARERDPEFWDRSDVSFWSGCHRNDGRINRSNILFPFRPNVCDQNFQHMQTTGEVRSLRLRAAAPASCSSPASSSSSATAAPSTSDSPGVPASLASSDDSGFALHVYPVYGSATARRFDRTAWACDESVIVVGNPALLQERLDHKVLRGEAVKEAAEHYDVDEGR
jgi:hypothetical protein